MSLKKDKRRRIKKEENITQARLSRLLVHKSYTDGRKLKINIVKWTAFLANFVRK